MTSPLLQSLASGFSGDDARRALLEAALRDGLPGPRSERWKYTPLRALDRRSFGTPGPATIDAALLDGIPAPRLVFVNGGFDAALSRLDALPAGVELAADGPGEASVPEATGDGPVRPGDTVFARLNVALARTGVHLRVAESVQVAQPVHLVFVGAEAGADAMAWHLRHRIEVAASASLRVIEHHLAHGVHRHLDTATLAVSVAQDALLEHARVQGPADGATSFARTDAVLQARAGYHRVDELDWAARCRGTSSTCGWKGKAPRWRRTACCWPTDAATWTPAWGSSMPPATPAASCCGAASVPGAATWCSTAASLIHPGADGTDARLSNKNLLLSPNAEIDTQPVLVIHADEVQAAHGATVGQLDANALFYLRARGVPQAEARQMLTAAFCREPLAAVEDAAVGEALLARLDAALEGLSA